MPRQTANRRIVVDGSNIATEGRTAPSLAQLDEAIRSFLEEHPGFGPSDVTVVVDATFGHRIDPSERNAFEAAIEHGEMVTPPAGAIGRGDGFILRIAEKSGALVLSNDSFQEFHAERPWLFEPGRLIGGKPVPGVGWVFTPRTPVRGPRSRSATAKSKRVGHDAAQDGTGSASQGTSKEPGTVKVAKAAKVVKVAKTEKAEKAAKATPASKEAKAAKAEKASKPAKATKAGKTAKAGKSASAAKSTKAAKSPKAAKATKTLKAAKALKVAKGAQKADGKGSQSTSKTAKAAKTTKTTKNAKATKTGKGAKVAKGAKAAKAAAGELAAVGGGRGTDGATAQASTALNDPMTFLTFVAEHPIGSIVEGTVVSFTSHGAHVDVEGMLCHIPLRGLGRPAPSRARQVLTKGETRDFVLVSLDATHRRAELALPGVGG